MTYKKFYAPSISEARKKADQALGRDYIVVETKNAANDKPAWIHVLDDGGTVTSEEKSTTYSRRDLFPKAFNRLKETVSDSLQLLNNNSYPAGAHTKSKGSASNEKPQARENSLDKKIATAKKNLDEKLQLKDELKALNDRFHRLEKLLSSQTVGANVQLVSHPAFQQLLANGVSHATIYGWFNEIISGGIDPYHQQEQFMPLLGKKIRQALDIGTEGYPASRMIFTGSVGSGKSSLIMKLVLHSQMLGDARCAIVSVRPSMQNYWHSPLKAFADQYEVDFYSLERKDQIRQWNAEWSSFDHVLIELSGGDAQASSVLFSPDVYRELLPGGQSLEVHTVVNATLNADCLRECAQFSDLASVDYIDFTHLDRISRQGHLIPFMQKMRGAVRYVSAGPQIPNDVALFEPARFAQQLLTVD